MRTTVDITRDRQALEAEFRSVTADSSLRPAQRTKKFEGIQSRLSDLDTEAKNLAIAYAFRAGNDLTAGDGRPYDEQRRGALAGAAGKSLTAPGLVLDENAMRAMYAAIKSKSAFRAEMITKAAADLTGSVPAQLVPDVIGQMHEGRILDHLRIAGTQAPAVEYIRHSSTTGAPATVAPGAAKPEVVFNTTTLTANVRKIAAHTGATHEALEDFGAFQAYVVNELQQQIIDTENLQLLSGDGTGQNLTGLLVTSGILTRAVATSPAEPSIDTFEQAIKDIRTGSAKGTANLIVVHPDDWSKIRRTKDSQGRYLVNPDPTSEAAQSLWSVPVVTTTVMTAGTGVVMDTAKAATVHLREGLSVQVNPYIEATTNVTRFIAEERLALAVERPSAIVKVTGL